MNPHVIRPNINSIKSTLVCTLDRHIVYLAILAGVHRKVERRRIHKDNIMDREVRNLDKPQNSRSLYRTLRMVLISIALESAMAIRAEDLHIIRVLHKNHVSSPTPIAVDSAVPLDRIVPTAIEVRPGRQSPFSRRDHDCASCLAGSECGVQRRTNVPAFSWFSSIAVDVAHLFGGLRGMRRCWAYSARQLSGCNCCQNQKREKNDLEIAKHCGML